MRYEVLLTDGAARDLESIHAYISESDSPASADRILAEMLKVAERLEAFPDRGSRPRELLALGYVDYRQIVIKPWRVVYRTTAQRVFILMVADGRRDMRTLLSQRLLRA